MKYNKETIQKSFGTHVKQLRALYNLTQVDLASKMNKDQQSIQRVESGNVSPSLFYLFEIANAFDIDIVELIDFEIIKKKVTV